VITGNRLKYLFMAIAVCFALQASARPLGPDCAVYFETNYPMTEFRLIGQGTAIDKRTNLMWYRCNVGEFWHGGKCRGSADRFTWQQALGIAQEAKAAGYTDWRLPTVKELKGLVEKKMCESGDQPLCVSDS